jgi:putative ABC transport system permease protein
MRSFLQDLGYAFQQLRKNPGFAATAIFSLALGIAATTSVFSVVYAVLLDPYPYKHADRMVHIVLQDKAGNEKGFGLTGSQVQTLRKCSVVDSVAAEDDWNLTTTGADVPEDVNGIYLTANATSHFGVTPLLGRGFIDSDAPNGSDPQPVAVLGYQFWQRYYGGDPAVLGRKLQLVHKPYLIVGVMPQRFTWGDGDVYLPLALNADPTKQFYPMVRLKAGVTHDAVNAALQPILNEFAKETPTHFPKEFRVRVQGLNDRFIKRLGHTLALLFGAVAVLLVIGCSNVSILLLARGTARRHELAVRAAIGASRSRIVTQLLTESLALSLSGVALGILLAYRTVALIVNWLPEYSFPHEAAIGINLPVLGFSVLLAVVTGVLFGLSPALRFSRPALAQVIQSSTRRVVGGVNGRRTHGILVGAQIALTMLLLSAAGAAMESFLHLAHASLGYDPHNTMSVGIPVHDNTYKTWEERSVYFDQIRQRLAAMPEVEVAGISTNATPPSNGNTNRFEILGRPVLQNQELRTNFISPEYFSVLRIPLAQGRLWDHAETMRGAHLAVINQTMAHQYWPNGDALGQQIRIPDLKSDPPYSPGAPNPDGWLQVVGIVADARNDGLRNPIKPQVYVPYTLSMRMFTQFLLRTHTAPLAVLHKVRAEVQAVNHDQQVFREVRNLEQWITTQPEWQQESLVTTLFGAFAILALLLSAIGLYSVVSYSVAQRTPEFGIRMALGAQPRDVLRNVLNSMVFSIGGGVAAGALLTLFLSRVIANWVEGGSHDPLILIAVVCILAGASTAACFIPAKRASAVDPMVALRYE